jgi:hypothetical protein
MKEERLRSIVVQRAETFESLKPFFYLGYSIPGCPAETGHSGGRTKASFALEFLAAKDTSAIPLSPSHFAGGFAVWSYSHNPQA